MKLTKLLVVALCTSLFISCSDDDDKTNDPKGVYDNGVFILNEGNSSGGSVSFLSDDQSTFTANVYSTVNGNDYIGTYLQHIFFDGDKAYIIAGGSNVINVVNRYTFQLLAKIESGLKTPRYGVVKDGKAYVTNANTYAYANPETGDTDDFIAVIDLKTNKVESTIPLNGTANRIELANNKLYVSEPYSSDAIIVVNPNTNQVESRIAIGYDADTMEEEDGILYVMRSPYGNRSEIVKIKLADNSISKVTLGASLDGAKNLDIENDVIYFTVNTGVYQMNRTATTAPTTPVFEYTSTSDYGKMYGFAVNDGRIYIADGGDFASNSKAYIYSLNGTLEKELTVGVGPNGFYFN
ncbi:YncE family protein [Flavobacterium agrisoli]|uniref:YVTN family beta-propeller protein n=1 Tax=Flavobacterium agrisoli TaxID=2793066 RepID=A0A934UL73_9FLAO|nr:DUF5074 domain-containing protein [Flavobacterium agrisoli]MBK0371205.1 hypothetical protein [Flavobacterium agrisoli]